ncbi:MAG: SDR family oxidoreductase [Candidatus Omnitrophica bacterium]|nr:SDR family oxidoreductase [Candidatus Omnitrophota bacterium]
MAHEITVPRLGWTMEEGTFGEWLKEDGERVEVGDPLFVLESDKATTDVEAVDSGILRIPPDTPQQGDPVSVGMVLAYLVEEGEPDPWTTGPQPRSEKKKEESDSAGVPVLTEEKEHKTEIPNTPSISPRAARVAAELGVAWTTLQGSGRGGRIVERDIRNAVQPRKTEDFISMKVDLRGKVSLVTGAARGIGQAIADRLAANGSRVIYTDIDAKGAKEAVSRSEECTSLAMDVTNSGEIEEVVAQVVRDYGSLDILVNNAGVNTLEHRVPIDEFPLEEWERLLSVDLTGLYLVSRAGARVMRKQGSGRIINIASIVGLVPLRLQCAFVAAKAGVINLTKAMALELGPHGILVNGIAPGSTMTEGTRQLFYGEGGKFHESVQKLLDHIPLGRPATTDEIAVAALFLAAPDNSYMNGHILTVDGGWTAGYAREF